MVLPRAGRGGVHCRPISRQYLPDLVRPNGRELGVPVPPSGVAAFAYGGRPRDCRRRGTSPDASHREPDPGMADGPRAWALYRRGDFRRGRLRQNVGLYAPVRAPTLGLASEESRATTGRAGAGSQRLFLPRHPPDAGRAGPGRGLHRALSRWPADVESLECDMALFVLARLHRGVRVSAGSGRPHPLSGTLGHGRDHVPQRAEDRALA